MGIVTRRRPGRSLRGAAIALALAAASEAVAASGGHPTVLRIRRDVRSQEQSLRRDLASRRAQWPRFLTDTSRNATLFERGLVTRGVRPTARPGARRSTVAAADTARVLCLRLGFAANSQPTLTSMDPSGDFRSAPDSTAVIDPPPHDVDYFAAHFVALDAYYALMSDGQLVVEGTVWPPAGEPSAKLSDMADYGPGAGGRWTIELLERYVVDALGALDQAAAGRLDLRRYDSFFIVHPGSDLQNDIRQDSPNDLPTFFVTLADSLVVPVQAGQDTIGSALVLPEQLSQDGLVGGLLGTICHEFGHQLGLPDWYDTYYGLPVVGEWDLMDSGNQAIFAFQVQGSEEVHVAYGILPTGLSAVDRWLLGWDEPQVVRAPLDSMVLRPANDTQETGPRSARLDVSPDEFFVVENRRDLLYAHPDDITPCPYLNRDSLSGVVLWTSHDDDRKPSRQRRNSGEYDFFIGSPSAPPAALGECGEVGFGLLVWHLDVRVLLDGYPTNEVNIDERRRALRVLEASGDFELGDWRLPTASFFGDGYNDPFRDDAGPAVRLGEATRPNNWNNDWALTGWEIAGVRDAPPQSHWLVVRTADGLAGWPREIPFVDSLPAPEPRGAVWAPVGGLGPTVVLADSAGLWGLGEAAGERAFTAPLEPTSLAYAPQLAPGDADGTLAALGPDRLWLWDASLAGSSLQVRAGFPVLLPSGGGGRRLALLDASSGASGALVELADGAWAHVDAAGGLGGTFDVDAGEREAEAVVGIFGTDESLGWSLALVGKQEVGFFEFAPGGAPARWAHGLDAPDSLLLVAGGRDLSQPAGIVVVLHRDGRLRAVAPDRGVLPGFTDLPSDEYHGLGLADLNGDGELDILAASATRIAGETSRGARLLETPRTLRDVFALQTDTRITSGPVVADVAGDSLPEILVGTDAGLVYALDASGRAVSGFPRKLLADRLPQAILATDVDDDGNVEILGVDATRAVAIGPQGGTARAEWAAEKGNAARTGYALAGPPIASGGARIRALERPLLAYPNPSRDGQVRLRITSERPGPYALAIYNLEGERVFERQGEVPAGTHEIAWSAGGLASGVYLCRFVCAAAGVSKPLVEPITLLR